MKKTLFFILMILVLMVSSCNLFLKEEYGELILSFDGSLPDGARALDSNGLPSLLSSPMKINIIRENGYTITRELGAEEPKSLVELVPVGEKIGIKVILISDLAEWAGYAEHIVTAGPNRVVVELSKKSKGVANLLFSITGKAPSGSNIVSLSTQNGKKLLDGILIGSTKPIAARDKVGRIYVLYEDTSSTRHLKRFDVEGKEDTGFEAALAAVLPSGVTISYIDNIAIDIDDNYIFLFKQNTVYCFKEKEDHSFQSFSYDSFPTVPAPVPSSSAVAVYDDVLFAVYNDTLFACGFEFEDLLTPGNKRLKFESQASRNPLNKLRTEPIFGNNLTECTGLFADESGVYCLLKEQELRHGKLYALGQLVCYTYSGSTFTKKAETGLNPAASTADPIAFDAQYFSNPVGFIGYDEENIYIADDGLDIQYVNENWHIKSNKNRIAAFKRNTNAITFEDTAATWYEQKPEYKKPETKVLLWKKGNYGMLYWTSTDGTDAFSEENKLFEDSPGVRPTDKFCYDQDGNLYIMYQDAGSNKGVRRFALKEDGSYEKSGLNYYPITSFPIFAIAVDISDGQNFLYYAYNNGPNGFIQRFRWNLGDTFDHATPDGPYLGKFYDADKAPVTALAANKDGVFAAVKETYKEVVSGVNIDKYRLKVKKYTKTGNPAHLDSEITLVDNAVSYTDVSDPPNPIADPNPGDDPNQACHQYQETINGLQIGNGRLYGISSKLHRKWILYNSRYFTDVFKHSSILYKIGKTADGFSGNAEKLAEKTAVPPQGSNPGVGYGFYRFIAVKYDEAERIKFIIASDSAWGDGVSSWNGDNSDNIVEFSLKDMLFKEDKQSGGGFSKTFNSSGFAWY
ncbi:hypothetical protein E4N85_03180 [Treponema denticola]|uniref:hypothetical protein n=1 Tax=Treponema denticola TaxID=158 RepID=UPI0020A3148F|nr:hypothetical protein [Treponema denticola]UTC94795.1 hypothetical protein E4N85_03180 [Treponema denticola]